MTKRELGARFKNVVEARRVEIISEMLSSSFVCNIQLPSYVLPKIKLGITRNSVNCGIVIMFFGSWQV